MPHSIWHFRSKNGYAIFYCKNIVWIHYNRSESIYSIYSLFCVHNNLYRFPKIEAGGGPETKHFIGVALARALNHERERLSVANLSSENNLPTF